MNSDSLISRDILLVDKPVGVTSFDVIRILRRRLGIKKMGHAGTLDPSASGLLVVGINEGTKKLQEFLKLPKVYEAEITLGIETDTLDMDGKIVRRASLPHFSREAILAVIKSLEGKQKLPAPRFSAIKRRGIPLYVYARRGIMEDPPIKEMEVRKGAMVAFDGTKICATFEVTSGTYIRSLAAEIGKRLGIPATLSMLRRISIGSFLVTAAKKPDDFGA